MDPGGGAGGVIDVVGASFRGETSFPVGGKVGLWLAEGGHGLSGRVWKRKGVGRWRSKGKCAGMPDRELILRLGGLLFLLLLFCLFCLSALSRLPLLSLYHVYNRGRANSVCGDRHHQPPVHGIRFTRPILQIIRNNFCKINK